MNNPFVQERPPLRRPPDRRSRDRQERIDAGVDWRGAAPRAGEIERATAVSRECKRSPRGGRCPSEREREAWTSLAKILLTANEFLYVD